MPHVDSPVALPIQLGDLELHTVMDEGFFGSYELSPKPHSHPYCEVIAAITGELRLELLDGDNIFMYPGDLCVIPPGCIHCTCSEDMKTEKLAVRFSFHRIKSASSVYSLFEDTLTQLKAPYIFAHDTQLSSLLLRIRQEISEHQLACEALTQALLQQFYVGVLRLLCQQEKILSAPQHSASDSKNARYYIIETWFAARYADQITECDLAQKLGLSKRQVSRVLRDIYGMSFREKLIEIRLLNAVRLLTQTDSPVEKIAFLIGYTTPSGFYTAFRRRFGLSASAYRKQNPADSTPCNRE